MESEHDFELTNESKLLEGKTIELMIIELNDNLTFEREELL